MSTRDKVVPLSGGSPADLQDWIAARGTRPDASLHAGASERNRRRGAATQVSGLWDEMWATFRDVVGHLNESLRVEKAGFVVRMDYGATDVFPFREWASYSPVSSPGDEQLVVSLDFKRDGNVIHGHLDLARGDGFVLADEQVADAFDETSIDAPEAIRHAEERLRRFVETNRALIQSELNHPRP